MTVEDRHLVFFHIAFFGLALALLAVPTGLPLGVPLLLAGVAYNVALPVVAHRWGHGRWIRLWLFLFPLSLLQILPDWFLADALETIVFPHLGVPKIGAVSAFMGLMWIVPLFAIVYVGDRVAGPPTALPAGPAELLPPQALRTVAFLTFLVFVSAEGTLTLIPVWEAQNVWTVGPIAVYVLLPEVLLGLSAFAAWRLWGRTDDLSANGRLVVAAGIMVIYTGNLALAYLLLEKTLLPALG